MRDYVDAVILEADLRGADWRMPFDSIYFGGGTPSLVPPDETIRILDGIRGRFEISEDAEITLEANPGNLSEADLAALRAGGVNRLSLGLQSLDDRDLKFLTRDHSAAEGIESYHAARRAGFDHITVDLMYGIPERPLKRWREQVETVCALDPEHVSAYQLTFEKGTPFNAMRLKGEMERLSEGGGGGTDPRHPAVAPRGGLRGLRGLELRPGGVLPVAPQLEVLGRRALPRPWVPRPTPSGSQCGPGTFRRSESTPMPCCSGASTKSGTRRSRRNSGDWSACSSGCALRGASRWTWSAPGGTRRS